MSENKKISKNNLFSNLSFNAKIVLIALILLFFNFIIQRLYFRLDLTENNQYSLSPATEKILKGMDDIVNLEAYFSSDMPERVQNIRNQLRDLMEEFRARSRGKLQFKFIDPGKDQALKQQLRMKGIQEVNLNVVEKDRASIARVYMGLVILFQDKHETIPVIDRVDNLEYQIISAVKKLSSKEILTVGYTAGKGERDIEQELPPLAEALRQQYDLLKVDLAKPVDEKVRTLIILGPRQKYLENELFFLDQFILKGGRIFFGIDQVTFGDGNNAMMGKPIDTGLEPLLANIGVSVEKNLISDLRCAQAPFRTSFGTLIQHYPLWPKLVDFNKEIGMVNRIDSLVLQWASSVKSLNKKDVKSQVLVSSSNKSWEQKGFFQLSPQTNENVPAQNLKAFSMAMILDGPYESMFKGKPLPPEIKEAPMLPEKTVAGRFIVMGDSEYIIYGLQNRQQRGNVNFFLNGIDYLTLGDDLIGIRSKQITDRPLSPAVRQSDSLRNFLKFMTIFLMPFALMSIGIFRYLKRRNIRRMYESVFKKESAG